MAGKAGLSWFSLVFLLSWFSVPGLARDFDPTLTTTALYRSSSEAFRAFRGQAFRGQTN
jgi:hypothetical protein